MKRDYDLFEQFPDKSIYWRARVCGVENARLRLRDFVKGSKHSFFAINLRSRETILLDPESCENSPETLMSEEEDRTVETFD